MGLFDIFRKRKPTVSLPQLAYDVAYFILPRYAFADLNKVIEMWTQTPTLAGPFFYLMACQMRETEPVEDDAPRFQSDHGQFDAASEYYLLEYPVPPPVDMSDMSPERLVNSPNPPVLAPHFSAVIRNSATNDVSYFVLGQAPLGGGTTLRSILPEGMNCNLGPGPAPEKNAFLDAICNRQDGS